MSSPQCSECGQQLKPNAKFCSYCGVSLKKRHAAVTPAEINLPSAAVAPSIEPAQEVESIPPQVEAALIMRGKLETLRSQKVALDEEQETVKVKQLVGELSDQETQEQLNKLNKRLDPINKEMEELESKALTPLEQLQQEQIIQEGRIQRLEELLSSGEVDETVHQRLSTEYNGKLAEITQQLETEIKTANHWLVQLEERKQQLEFERETLQIRARIDEISKQDVNKQLKVIDEEINKLASIISGLRSLLGSAAPPPPISAKKPSTGPKKEAKAARNECPYCQAKITAGTKYCYTCGRLIQG
jgi:DNA repair exonuclease SbcCD ATPase subunit